MNNKIIVMIGFEDNGIIAFYRKPRNSSINWSQMQAIKVRYYWYKILYERLPDLLKSLDRKIEIYEEF
jgi:hypothetical protein